MPPLTSLTLPYITATLAARLEVVISRPRHASHPFTLLTECTRTHAPLTGIIAFGTRSAVFCATPSTSLVPLGPSSLCRDNTPFSESYGLGGPHKVVGFDEG